MKKQSLPLGMILGGLMVEVFHAHKKRIVERAEVKLPNEQIGLLHAISQKKEEVIQKDLADILGKDKSSILRLIDSLEEKELVRRIVDKNDRRKNYLKVTKNGKCVIEQYIKLAFELTDDLQQGLTASDMDTFYKVVNQIKSNAKKL